jgi:hypothetical protein
VFWTLNTHWSHFLCPWGVHECFTLTPVTIVFECLLRVAIYLSNFVELLLLFKFLFTHFIFSFWYIYTDQALHLWKDLSYYI